MVLIDDDILFRPEDMWKIVEGARETRSIYCGGYLTHSATPHLTSSGFSNNDPITFHFQKDRLPHEIRYGAAGFMAIHRSVVEAMEGGEYRDADGPHFLHRCDQGRGAAEPAFVPFFDTFTIREEDGSYTWLSEDYAFCERARQLGFSIWLDRSIELGHMSEHSISTGGVFGPTVGTDSLLIQYGEQKVDLPVSGDWVLDDLPDDIAHYAQMDVTEIKHALSANIGTGILAKLWESRGEQDEESWYQREDVGKAYILDLATWHMSGGGAPLADASRLKGKRVLDYGAGIGTFALAAARAGADVVTYEPNTALRDLMIYRANTRGLALCALDPDDPIEGKFDAIVCWHVFEHVANPVELLDRLVGLLAPGGELIQDVDFHADDDHPQHHTFEGDWDALVAERLGQRPAELVTS